MSSAEERETIHRALTGDQIAYRKLYQTNRDRITATIAQRTKDPDDIDDLVQVSFIRAFSTWLTRIALNVCITHHQTRRITLPESMLETEPESIPKAPSPEDDYYRKQTWNKMLTEINELPSRYRSVMWLHYVEDRPYPELVERLNIPIGTLKTWLFRGRQLVRESVNGPERNA